MDIKRFEYLLDLHGADFSRWDADDAAQARQFADTDTAARALLTEAQALDALLDIHEPAPMPAALKQRIMNALDDTQHMTKAGPRPINDNYPARRTQMLRSLSYGGMALAASVVLFVLSFTAGSLRTSDSSVAAPQQLAANEDVELFLLAMADPVFDEGEAERTAARVPALSAPVAGDTGEVDLFLQSLEEGYIGLNTGDL